jgi:hypothetical protein
MHAGRQETWHPACVRPSPARTWPVRSTRHPRITLRPRHALCDALDHANGQHRGQHRSRHGLRGGVAIATLTLRSTCTPSAPASPRKAAARKPGICFACIPGRSRGHYPRAARRAHKVLPLSRSAGSACRRVRTWLVMRAPPRTRDLLPSRAGARRNAGKPSGESTVLDVADAAAKA